MKLPVETWGESDVWVSMNLNCIFVFYHLNITFWGLGQVAWINWIRTQLFVPGKMLFHSSYENNLPPSTPVFIFFQILPASDCRVRFTKAGHGCTCRTWAQIHPREILSRGTDPSFQWNLQNLPFCTPPGDSLPRESSVPGWARDFQSQKRSMCTTKSWEKRNPTKGGPKSPTLFKNKAFQFCLCTLWKSCTNSQQEGCKVAAEVKLFIW